MSPMGCPGVPEDASRQKWEGPALTFIASRPRLPHYLYERERTSGTLGTFMKYSSQKFPWLYFAFILPLFLNDIKKK